MHQLLSAGVIDQFLVGAVLGHLPREKLVEGIAAYVEARQGIGVVGARFGKEFVPGQDLCRGRFIRIIERSVVGPAHPVVRRVAIANQVIPARENHATKTIHKRIEDA